MIYSSQGYWNVIVFLSPAVRVHQSGYDHVPWRLEGHSAHDEYLLPRLRVVRRVVQSLSRPQIIFRRSRWHCTVLSASKNGAIIVEISSYVRSYASV